MKPREYSHKAILFFQGFTTFLLVMILGVLGGPSTGWTLPAPNCHMPLSWQFKEILSGPAPYMLHTFHPEMSRGKIPDDQLAQQRDRHMDRYEQWRNLQPEDKDALRRRMNQWNQMSPQDRQRYQRRYDQWQQLSPDERGQMHNKVDRWQNLSPEEKEGIRRRFRE